MLCCANPAYVGWEEVNATQSVNLDTFKSELITPHGQYLRFDHRELERRKAYRSLFKAHIDQPGDDEIRAATNGNYVLDNKRYDDAPADGVEGSVPTATETWTAATSRQRSCIGVGLHR